MRTVHNNGEFWYENTDPLWKRVLLWFVWYGGIWPTHKRDHRGNLRWRDFVDLNTPIAFLGHRFVWFGDWWRLRLRHGHLVYASNHGVRARSGQPRQLYFSPDGTPSAATTWYLGAPPDVEREVTRWKAQRAAWREARAALPDEASA